MGKRGPQPKSNEKKALEGNPGQRKLEETPQVEDVSTGSLRIPTRLCVEGKKVWHELMDSFPDWYFTGADKHLLVMYCEHVARRNKLEKQMRNAPMTVKRGNGSECLNPKVRAIMDIDPLVLKLAEKLGITRDRRRGISRNPTEAPVASDRRTQDLDSDQGGDVAVDDVGDLLAPAINVH